MKYLKHDGRFSIVNTLIFLMLVMDVFLVCVAGFNSVFIAFSVFAGFVSFVMVFFRSVVMGIHNRRIYSHRDAVQGGSSSSFNRGSDSNVATAGIPSNKSVVKKTASRQRNSRDFANENTMVDSMSADEMWDFVDKMNRRGTNSSYENIYYEDMMYGDGKNLHHQRPCEYEESPDPTAILGEHDNLDLWR